MAKTAKSSKKISAVKLENISASEEPAIIGSARGIESMYRNSYRAQLDMIALAAMKANIMISLNGLLVSMLFLSGAYFIATDKLLLIPIASFLITCTTAIIYAVLAARPDFRRSVKTLDDFRCGNADLLIFEQFSTLSAEEFDSAMQEMIRSNGGVYTNMTAHIYSLGCMANKKFARLFISYNTFIFGLVTSVALLLFVIAYRSFYSVGMSATSLFAR